MRIINGLGWIEIIAPQSWIVLDIDSRDLLRRTVDTFRSNQTAMDALRYLCSKGGPVSAMSDDDVARRITEGLTAGDICIDAAHWFECSFVPFPSENAARLFVQSLLREPGAMASLRSIVSRHQFSLNPLSDNQVVEQISVMIHRGALRVRTGQFVWNSCVPEAEPQPAAPPPVAASPPPPPSRAPAPESPSEFEAFADYAGIAAAMREAARLGVPFCEECYLSSRA
jgi:hypothetical protein